MNKKQIEILRYLVIFLTLVLFPAYTNQREFPQYRVVVDPGHGGLSLLPVSRHGDRYDPLTGKFLEPFAAGCARPPIEEHEIMYEIGKKVYDLLMLTTTPEGYVRFSEILQRYVKTPPQRIEILPMLSRGDSRDRNEIGRREDPNAEFRLFDYPDKYGKIQPGRLSKINAFRPHMVVSMHCDGGAPIDHQGFTAVIVPPYSLLEKGRWFLEDRNRSIDFFRNSRYNLWFMDTIGRSAFKCFIGDSILYYTAFGMNDNYSMNLNRYRGYRHNMVTWRYADSPGWQTEAGLHRDNSQYSDNIMTFVPKGRFWLREQSVYEQYRRDGGPEGWGGDNLYATNEVIRYMCLSLKSRGLDSWVQFPGNPHISIWHVPMHVNAISVFMEMGYLSEPRFRYLLTERQDELAEGIAVGIYSLFAGLDLNETQYKYVPKAQALDLKKYDISESRSYFDIVVPEYWSQ